MFVLSTASGAHCFGGGRLNSKYLTAEHDMPDDFVGDFQRITPRGAYWLQVVRLTRSRDAMEWGTGCGSNVMQLASVYTDVNWYGVDSSSEQIEHNKEQAGRLKIASKWAVDPAPELFYKMDCVAVLDCLEHTLHPDALLDKAEKYVRPGSTMVISVPNGPWSLHTPNDEITLDGGRPGNHVAVGSPATLIPYIQTRGILIDVRVIQTRTSEGNSSLCIAYEPAHASWVAAVGQRSTLGAGV